MSVINKIACMQNRRDEIPNQELARELAEAKNTAGIKEIADNLFNKDKNIASDCLKVLYETGSIHPELIAGVTPDFLKLLKSKNNRMVWGAMIALAVVAPLAADEIYKSMDIIYASIQEGSVITIDNGIKVLAAVASKKQAYSGTVFPYLLEHLKTCRPKEVGQHAESIFMAVNAINKEAFLEVLKSREASLTSAQLARVRKLYKAADKIK